MADIVVWQDMANDDAENLNVQDGPATPTTRPATKPDDPVQGDDEAAKKTKSEKKRRQKAKKAAEVREFKEKTTYQQIEIVLNDAVPNGALYENEKDDLLQVCASGRFPDLLTKMTAKTMEFKDAMRKAAECRSAEISLQDKIGEALTTMAKMANTDLPAAAKATDEASKKAGELANLITIIRTAVATSKAQTEGERTLKQALEQEKAASEQALQDEKHKRLQANRNREMMKKAEKERQRARAKQEKEQVEEEVAQQEASLKAVLQSAQDLATQLANLPQRR